MNLDRAIYGLGRVGPGLQKILGAWMVDAHGLGPDPTLHPNYIMTISLPIQGRS